MQHMRAAILEMQHMRAAILEMQHMRAAILEMQHMRAAILEMQHMRAAIPETSNHATTLTPIQVTTTHHNITATNLNNGMLGAVAAKSTMHTVTSGANAGGSRLVTSSTTTPAALLEKQQRDQALRVFERDGYTLFDPKKENCEGKSQSYTMVGWSRSYEGCSGKVIPITTPGTELLHPSANAFEFGNLAPRP
jgi:hypothetical protein